MSALLGSIAIDSNYNYDVNETLSEEEEEVASLFEEPNENLQEMPDEQFVVQADEEENPSDRPDEEPYIPTEDEIAQSQEETQVAAETKEFEKIIEENLNKKQLRGKELARYVSELRKSGKVRKPKSKNKKAGVLFPIVRILRQLKKEHPEKRISDLSGVYLSAVIEYLSSEILDLAGWTALNENKKLISPHHILVAVKEDYELNNLLKGVTFPFSGVVPSPEIEESIKRQEEEQSLREKESRQNESQQTVSKQITQANNHEESSEESGVFELTIAEEPLNDAEGDNKGDRQQQQQQQQQQQKQQQGEKGNDRGKGEKNGNQGVPGGNGGSSGNTGGDGRDGDDRREKKGGESRNPKEKPQQQQQESESEQTDETESDATEGIEPEITDKDRETMSKIGRKGGIISGIRRRQKKAERERTQSEASEQSESERSSIVSPSRGRRASATGLEEGTPRRTKGRQGVKRSPGPDLRKEARGRRGRKRSESGINIRDIQVETGQIPKSRREEQEEREAAETKKPRAPRKRKSQDITPTKQTTLDENVQHELEMSTSRKRTRAKRKPEPEYEIEERSHFDYEVQIHNDYHYNIKCNSIPDLHKLLTSLQQRNKEVRENVAHISVTGDENQPDPGDQEHEKNPEIFEKQMSERNPKTFEKKRSISQV